MAERSRGILYVVAVPIGNPEDFTARAKRILSEVDLIACEDTRRTGRLQTALEIHKPMLSYYEHNERERAPELVARLTDGAKIALITDAGTPGISDPGFRLLRGAIDAGITVTPVPGPSAIVAALSVSGLPTNRFTFEGYLPPRGGARTRVLESLRGETRTMVFYETARRLSAALAEMARIFGEGRRAVVARELTKTYEEIVRDTLDGLARRFAHQEALGEITVIVEGAAAGESSHEAGSDTVTIETLLEAGMKLKEASAVIARLTNRSRREVYQEAIHKTRLKPPHG